MTGWTWDYVRNCITFKRYLALKQSWLSLPPLPVTVFAIARCLGLEMKAAAGSAPPDQPQGDVFYDESYYHNEAATPWKDNAADALSSDFQAAGGEVTT